MSEAEEGLVRALRGVLADHGRRVSEHPERVRALLSDALGARSREWRADIDALVMAAEERVPATVTDTAEGGRGTDDAALVRALTDRGLTAETAIAAIDLWRSVLTDAAQPTTRSRTASAWDRPTAAPSARPRATPTAAPPAASTAAPAHAAHSGSSGRPGLPLGALEPAAPTELPWDLDPRPLPPTGPSAPTGPPTPTSTAGPFLATSAPKVITMGRGRAVGIGAAAVVAALVAGGVGARQLDSPPRTTALVAATPTVQTSTVTSTTLTTVTVTKPPRTVTSTVVVDPTKLKAISLSGNTLTYVAFVGSKGCNRKPPKKGTSYSACSTWDYVEAKGTVKSWKITSATVLSGGGTASGEGKKLNYYYTHNGPYTAKVRYVIEGSGYRSTATYTFRVQCNPYFPCKSRFPA